MARLSSSLVVTWWAPVKAPRRHVAHLVSRSVPHVFKLPEDMWHTRGSQTQCPGSSAQKRCGTHRDEKCAIAVLSKLTEVTKIGKQTKLTKLTKGKLRTAKES